MCHNLVLGSCAEVYVRCRMWLPYVFQGEEKEVEITRKNKRQSTVVQRIWHCCEGLSESFVVVLGCGAEEFNNKCKIDMWQKMRGSLFYFMLK